MLNECFQHQHISLEWSLWNASQALHPLSIGKKGTIPQWSWCQYTHQPLCYKMVPGISAWVRTHQPMYQEHLQNQQQLPWKCKMHFLQQCLRNSWYLDHHMTLWDLPACQSWLCEKCIHHMKALIAFLFFNSSSSATCWSCWMKGWYPLKCPRHMQLTSYMKILSFNMNLKGHQYSVYSVTFALQSFSIA